MHGREDEMFRSGERCAMGESKIVQLEEELMVRPWWHTYL